MSKTNLEFRCKCWRVWTHGVGKYGGNQTLATFFLLAISGLWGPFGWWLLNQTWFAEKPVTGCWIQCRSRKNSAYGKWELMTIQMISCMIEGILHWPLSHTEPSAWLTAGIESSTIKSSCFLNCHLRRDHVIHAASRPHSHKTVFSTASFTSKSHCLAWYPPCWMNPNHTTKARVRWELDLLRTKPFTQTHRNFRQRQGGGGDCTGYRASTPKVKANLHPNSLR